MTWTRALTEGLAQFLENHDVGTFNSSGVPYQTGATAITVDYLPASPDKVVTLTLYSSAEDPTQADAEASLQIRVRGTKDPRVAMDMGDAAFDALQNLPRALIGGSVVAGCWVTNHNGYLGADEGGRHSRVSNYRLLVHHPSPNRT
jgi:Bacteriophage minor capsid protein